MLGCSSKNKSKPKKKPTQQRKAKAKPELKTAAQRELESPKPEPKLNPEPEPKLNPEPEPPPKIGRTPRKTPRKAVPMTPLFSPALQQPIAPTRDAYMQHLGTRLRTIGLDKVPSLAEMSPGLDESGTDTGERAQVWTELWALHRENRTVENKDSGGSNGSDSTTPSQARLT